MEGGIGAKVLVCGDDVEVKNTFAAMDETWLTSKKEKGEAG